LSIVNASAYCLSNLRAIFYLPAIKESNVPSALTRGDYRALEYIAHYHPELLLKKDPNGWQPVHEVRFFSFIFFIASLKIVSLGFLSRILQPTLTLVFLLLFFERLPIEAIWREFNFFLSMEQLFMIG